ncbi:MAG TPA: LysR family transcriptional regulator [Orrella sp.]
MAIEFRHLKYFVVLAEELHFGRAAKRLHISQPPLSFNIKQLEESLGVQLLIRSSKGVRLTPAGHAFRQSAIGLLAHAEAASTEAREVAAGVTSRVRIGFVGSMLYRGLSERLQRFQSEYPKVQLVLTEANSNEQLDALAKGELDVGFVHTDRISGDLEHCLYMSEPFVLCLPSAHPAAAVQDMDNELMASTPLVLFSRGVSPDYYERVIAACAGLGWKPLVRHEVRHWLSVLALVRKGMGAALVPAALTDSGMTGLVFKELPPLPVVSDVHLVWRVKSVPEPLLACLRADQQA